LNSEIIELTTEKNRLTCLDVARIVHAMQYPLFISCPPNLEILLQQELLPLGLQNSKPTVMGVFGEADLASVYRICLWSRIANRVQLRLLSGLAPDKQTLYRLCYAFAWNQLFEADKTFAVEFHGHTPYINNSMYGAQLVKDAIVDYFKQFQQRPNVDRVKPDIRIHAHIKNFQLSVSLDLVGYSLHQRGYRMATAEAPLKENLAAAILFRANWPALYQQGAALVDPCCGSGTFLIEAALMAANRAPGLLRDDQALPNWLAHDAELWQATRQQALDQQRAIEQPIVGFDNAAEAVDATRANLIAANLADAVTVQQSAVHEISALPERGLLVTNPPYGERLQDPASVLPLYQELGQLLYQHAQGWQAAVLTSETMLAQAIGLRSHKQYGINNGAIETRLYCFDVDNRNQPRFVASTEVSESQQALANRLRKNRQHLKKWLKRTGHQCYRVYDADIPEYAFAVDVYGDWAHVQEYMAPAEIPLHKTQQRLLDLLHVLPEVLDIPREQVVLKQRQPQKGTQQYQALAKKRETLVVNEGKAKLIVNLYDYLDTGLFLDHRWLRLYFSEHCRGKRFLNCFCYTASASVHAALGGAVTTNVDLSNTYLDWAEQNFRLNHLPVNKHNFIQADCTQWLTACRARYDVIFLDPPSFSNSKRMRDTLDIQRDHVSLIDAAMRLLEPGGQLYFSNNLKKFKLSTEVVERYRVEDISQLSLDEDFKRAKPSHHCFVFSHRT